MSKPRPPRSGNKSRRRGTRSTASAPPKAAAGAMRVVALGGLGEVGRNMMAVEYDSRIVIVDVGVLFPDGSQPGVDVILPDFGYLSGRWSQVAAVLLTHGHLDHIGGLPYLLRHAPQVPVFGTALTLALAGKVCAEHQVTPQVRLIGDGDRFQVDGFEVEAVAVNHSIPDALAYALRTPAGMLLHTGDFKMDQFPADGVLTDLRRFAALGDEGVALLCTDSTNADVPGFVLSEKELVPAIGAVFASAEGLVVASTFASHVHRVQALVDASVRHGRKVAFAGRSMVTNMAMAAELGYLTLPAGVTVDVDRVPELDPRKVTVICTGSQGEAAAALGRMADGRHPIELGAGDTVLLASSMVPGNESAVTSMIDRLTARRVRVVHKGTARVHTSGHAAAGELSFLYNVVRPAAVMPVHGEWRHLYANAALAQATGVPAGQVCVGGNGTVWDVDGAGVVQAGTVPVVHVYVESAAESNAATVAWPSSPAKVAAVA